MKKETKWITIPEEILHTPVSGQKGKTKTVGNKLFWGISFIVLVVVTFALLAPTQFNELLRGSLFDAPGVESPTEGIFGGEEEVAEEEVTEEVMEEPEEVVAEEEVMIEAEPVVQPEEEAVDIVIEPIVEPEEVIIEPVEEVMEEPAEEVVEEEPDAQAELVQSLSEQIEQLQKQREEDLKAMEELVTLVEEEVKPAAPPSVTTTTTLGQPPALVPGFRVNPYRVAQTPEQVLQQNLASGAQFAQAPAQPVIKPPAVSTTPDTGPSEILLITFALTFLGAMLWKLVRVFA